MHKFEIHLNSGQTLTWNCLTEENAETIQDVLKKIVRDPDSRSSHDVVSLGCEKKNNLVVFLEKDVVAFSYQNNVKRIGAGSFVSGGTVNGVHLGSGRASVVGGMLEGIQKAAHLSRVKNEEETN